MIRKKKHSVQETTSTNILNTAVDVTLLKVISENPVYFFVSPIFSKKQVIGFPGGIHEHSGIRYQVSGIKYQVLGIRYQVSGIGIRYQVSGIRY